MESPTPEISVVIPTHNRCGLLLETLESLAGQTLPHNRFEVVVALDSVTDSTEAVLAERTWPFPLVAVPVAARNASVTRNAGAARARGSRIVFLDDDIRVAPNFLRTHLAASADDPEVIVLGQSAPEIAGKGWFYDGLRTWWSNRFATLAFPGHRFSYTDLMSGNVSLSKAMFERLGGFDPTLPCREDYELGWRAIEAGARMTYAAEALGYHRDESDPERNLRRVRSEGLADIEIARRHPEAFLAVPAAGLAAPTRTSALLRLLFFRYPATVPPIMRTLSILQASFEMIGAQRLWRLMGYWRWGFAYHGGVATAVGSLSALYALRDSARTTRVSREVTLDLAGGIDAARHALEATRPDGCKIHVGSRNVGALGEWPGMEPLSARHLDGWLRANSHRWSLELATSERLAALPPDGHPVIPKHGLSVGELDLEDWSLRAVRQPLSLPLHTVVRSGRSILGWIWLEPEAGEPVLDAARRLIIGNRGICENVLRARIAPLAPEARDRLPPISVVVCTRDRTDNLVECLAALRDLDYPDYEIIVVDNAPRTDATARLVSSLPDVSYVREDRPGLDWARNRGLAAARHDIVAFTDDDTRADRHWLSGFAAVFSNPSIGAATGLVAPMEMASKAQEYFEYIYGGMGKGYRTKAWSLATQGLGGVLWSSGCGVGANMAVRRDVAQRVGLFDPALDVGTATRGGGDIEMFHRLLAGGATLQYTPDAMVWHRHRSDWEGLGGQIADNGSGFAAYLLAAWANRTVPRLAILRFTVRDWIGGWLLSRLRHPGQHRRELVLREIRGMLSGPARWREARRRAAELATAPTATALASEPFNTSARPS